MAKFKKKEPAGSMPAPAPVQVAAQADKPKQSGTRWARIQQTRRRAARTGEPAPGSLGVAYRFLPTKNLYEKVAVLTQTPVGKVIIQRAVGSQMLETDIEQLRTADEIWDDLKANDPKALPKVRVSPDNPSEKWEPTRLTADQAKASFSRTV